MKQWILAHLKVQKSNYIGFILVFFVSAYLSILNTLTFHQALVEQKQDTLFDLVLHQRLLMGRVKSNTLSSETSQRLDTVLAAINAKTLNLDTILMWEAVCRDSLSSQELSEHHAQLRSAVTQLRSALVRYQQEIAFFNAYHARVYVQWVADFKKINAFNFPDSSYSFDESFVIIP